MLIVYFSCKERKIQINNSSSEVLSSENQEQKNKRKECLEMRTSYLWKAEIDEKGDDFLIKGGMVSEIGDDLNLISTHLNKLHPPLEVQILGIEDSVLKVNFTNESILTQQLGTTGASQFIVSLVYSFTENKKIDKVEIDILEGDHFSSGVYSRDDFKNEYYILECK